jgi:hypothetical protein
VGRGSSEGYGGQKSRGVEGNGPHGGQKKSDKGALGPHEPCYDHLTALKCKSQAIIDDLDEVAEGLHKVGAEQCWPRAALMTL